MEIVLLVVTLVVGFTIFCIGFSNEYDVLTFGNEEYDLEAAIKALQLASKKIFEANNYSPTDEEINHKARMLLREANKK